MRVFLLVCLLAATAGPGLAQPAATDVFSAIRGGSVAGNFRLRHETVSQDGKADRAQAMTLRTVLGYRTGSFRSLAAYVEMETVADIIEDYNNAGAGDLGNGKTNFPVVADPGFAEVNQAYLRWAQSGTAVTVGRQEIVTGDSRFVGNVGWRQNHQSFDAIRVTSKLLDRVDLSYAYVDRVHRIFGGDTAMKSHLAHASVPIQDVATVSAYANILDYETDAGSSKTFGAQVTGSISAGDATRINFEAEFAKQREAFDNPSTLDANYTNFAVGAARQGFSLTLGQETLGGSTRDGAFSTPLATLHKFNGWADQFLGTPATGLVDRLVSVGYSRGVLRIVAGYHDYTSDSDSIDYGSELDIQLTYAVSEKPAIGLKLSRYLADAHSADITKVWVWTSLGF
jgi:Alginate export